MCVRLRESNRYRETTISNFYVKEKKTNSKYMFNVFLYFFNFLKLLNFEINFGWII